MVRVLIDGGEGLNIINIESVNDAQDYVVAEAEERHDATTMRPGPVGLCRLDIDNPLSSAGNEVLG